MRKEINKMHPKFSEYIAECEALANDCFQKIAAAEAKYPNWKGLTIRRRMKYGRLKETSTIS